MPTSTLLDKVILLPILGIILTKTLFAALTGPFRGQHGAPTYTEHVGNSLLRNLVHTMRVPSIQWLMPSFLDTYKSWCSKNNLSPDIVDIPGTKPTVQGFWIGSKESAKYSMVYFHGGGFVFAGSAQHIAMLLNFVKWSEGRLAIFCVCYTLAPEGAYPVALGQGVEALRYVLGLPGNEPSNTLIGGDSAGGNLALAVLSHVSGHPHPRADAIKRLDISGSLKGALVIAPWTSSDSDRYSSLNRYAMRDMLSSAPLQYWIGLYKGVGVNDDEYVCAALASADWWKGVKCEHMLATAGEQEALVDAISDWARKYEQGAGKNKIWYVIGEKEIHDQPLKCMPESKLIELGEKSQEGVIRLWIKQKLV